MRKGIILLLIFFSFAILFTACQQVKITPAPEVEVYHFNPVGTYIASPFDTVVIDTIQFIVWNHVDAIIREMSYSYRSVRNDNIVGSSVDAGLGFFLSGGDEYCEESCITTLLGIVLDVTDIFSYMYTNNDNVVAEITFSGEDAYGEEKEFSCKMYFAVMLAPMFSEENRMIPIETGGNNE